VSTANGTGPFGVVVRLVLAILRSLRVGGNRLPGVNSAPKSLGYSTRSLFRETCVFLGGEKALEVSGIFLFVSLETSAGGFFWLVAAAS